MPITRLPISEQVYTELKQQIVAGELPPGTRLPVMEIANRFQISQAPVREALERLKQEKLIIGNANRGSSVSNITSKEIKEIFVLREIIEGYVVRTTIALLTEEDFRDLETIVLQMNLAIKQQDTFKIIEHDMEFHSFFYERCNNHAIVELWNTLKIKVMRFMAISNKRRTTDGLVGGHRALIEVLRTGDAVQAEESFIDHMKSYKLIDLEEYI